MAGEVDEARSIVQDNIKMIEDLGLSSVVLKGFLLGNLEMNAGNWVAAVATIRQACDELEAAGEQSSLSTLAGSLALSLYQVGDLDEAFRYTQVSHEAGSEDDLATQLLWRAARGEVLASRGESEEALRAWRMHPEHVAAQRRGRTEFYSEYHLQTCALLHDMHFTKPAPVGAPANA